MTGEPEWSDFRIILALGRGGSVAGAARILNIDSSTVSRRLTAAEEAFGSVLVLRGGRDFAFTAEGKTALAAAAEMERQVNAALNAVRAAKTGVEGIVRVSCVPGLVRLLLPLPVLVNDRHPRLTVEVSSVFRQVSLARGESDIALRMVKPTEPDLIARQAFEIGVAVYASRRYIEKYGKPSSREELRKHRVVLYSEAFAHVAHFNWIDKYANPELPITRADGPDMACSLMAAGGGIGLADCHRGDREPELMRVFPEVTSVVPGWLVYHESQRDTPRIKTVAAMLEDFLHEHRDVLRGTVSEA